MNMKDHILAVLREQFDSWEDLLSSLSEELITTPQFDFDWQYGSSIFYKVFQKSGLQAYPTVIDGYTTHNQGFISVR